MVFMQGVMQFIYIIGVLIVSFIFEQHKIFAVIRSMPTLRQFNEACLNDVFSFAVCYPIAMP